MEQLPEKFWVELIMALLNTATKNLNTEKFTETDFAYIHGRLDGFKQMIIIFGEKDEEMLRKWQEIAEKLSYKSYFYSTDKK